MTAHQLKRIFQSENCLSLDTIKQYKQGKLAARNAYVVERHLLACSLCAEAFDSLDTKRMAEVDKVAARVNKRLATYMNTPPRFGFFQRFGFAVTAGILLLAGGGGVAWWLSNDDQKNTDSLTKNAPATVALADAGVGNTPATPVVYNTSSTTREPGNTTPNPVMSNKPAVTENAKKDNGKTAPATTAADARGFKTDSQQPIAAGNSGNMGASVPPTATQQPATSPDNGSSTRTPSTRPLEVVSSRLTMKLSSDADDRSASGKISDGQFTRNNKKKKHEQTLDQMPQFPGGDWNLDSYVQSHFHPVKIDRTNIKNFTAMAIVTVSAKGNVTKVELARGINSEVDAEIVRVLQGMPQWLSGKGDIDATVMVTVD